MKKVAALIVAVCCFGCSTPPNYTARHCTSNIHCHADEMCLTYNRVEPMYVPQSHGPSQPWRDGLCVKE